MSQKLDLLAFILVPGLIVAAAPASAEIIFSTGNQQYTNVNIAADVDALSITGAIGNTGINMTFDKMIGPDGTTQVSMHGQHGVAFVESFYDSANSPHTGFASITLTAQTGYGFSAGDFALDQLNSLLSPTGFVNFTATDQIGDISTGTLAIDQKGQNQYQFTGLNNELATKIVISVATSDLLQDFKALSLNVAQISVTPPVPEPPSALLLAGAATILGIGLRRQRSL
jgi:hypothetical protein